MPVFHPVPGSGYDSVYGQMWEALVTAHVTVSLSPGGRPELSFSLLAWPWPSHCRIWRVNQQMGMLQLPQKEITGNLRLVLWLSTLTCHLEHQNPTVDCRFQSLMLCFPNPAIWEKMENGFDHLTTNTYMRDLEDWFWLGPAWLFK